MVLVYQYGILDDLSGFGTRISTPESRSKRRDYSRRSAGDERVVDTVELRKDDQVRVNGRPR